MTLKRLLLPWLAIVMCASLAGCISLISEPDPITVYSLRAKPADDPAKEPKVPWSLTVIRPNSTSILDSNRIAVRPEANVLQVYKGANWSDSLPDLMQSVVVESFEDSGAIATVSRQNSGVPAEVALLIDIRQFEAVYASGCMPKCWSIPATASSRSRPSMPRFRPPARKSPMSCRPSTKAWERSPQKSWRGRWPRAGARPKPNDVG